MPFIDFQNKKKVKIWDGINAAISHSDSITFAHVVLDKGAIVPGHNHIHEQWTHVIEGEMEFNINGAVKLLTPGIAAYIPSNVPHSVKAITLCRVIDCFLPVREDFVTLEKEGWVVKNNNNDGKLNIFKLF